MKATQRPGVVFQPRVHAALQRGINQIVEAIKPTLGPVARVVAIDPINASNARPEVLDDGGLIARRIIEIGGRDEDMGAMLTRSMLLRQYEDAGDGTATAAVLFQALYEAGVRYLTAGVNAMRLRHYLEEALAVALEELDGMAFQIEGQEGLTRAALALCGDEAMAALFGEIFAMVGEHGQIDIRKGHGRGLKREYIEGIYYNTGLFSREMLGEGEAVRTEYQNPAIFLSDFELDDPHALFPVLKLAADADIPALVIIVRNMSEQAMAAILANKRIDRFRAMAVRLPGLNAEDRMAALQDLSLLTGAIPILKATGETLENATLQHFGQARRVWAERRHFGIIGGRGNPRQLREHAALLEQAYRRAQDPDQRKRLQERLGRLMSGSATLWVGGATESEIELRKAQADRTARALRTAVQGGVIPGGGVALLRCRARLEACARSASDADERAAYRILSAALAAPARCILANAGFDPGDILAQLAYEAPAMGFDVLQRRIADVAEAGILDSVITQQAALRNAVSTAALALTIDTLVHLRRPEITRE